MFFGKKSKFFIFSLLFASLFFLLSCSCGSAKNGKKFYVGIDPTFYPLGLGVLEKNTFGFTQELLLEMTEVMNIRFFVVKASWDNLLDGLKENKYQAIFSSMYPYNFSKEKFNFSKLFLNTGYALVTLKNSEYSSLEKMDNKLVGYIRGEDSLLLLENYPKITIKTYDAIYALLDDVENDFLDGAIVDSIKGKSFTNNLYGNVLKISPPLNEEGLRMISLKENEEIIKVFNSALEKLEKKGIVEKLRHKWSL